ncbi:MAG: ribonuclease H-like domain-containing protein [Pseudomonadota bacterium]|nr:ribonuclease H-like domain-containing protein [Pseudomonadota bacterium]
MKPLDTNEIDITLHQGDLPEGIDFGKSVAVDTETLGLNPIRDRLCLVQLASDTGQTHLVQFSGDVYAAPNLVKLLFDDKVTKIFHYARFDLAVLSHYLDIVSAPVFCTKIASRLTRTYTEKHGLKDLCGELLGIEISKNQQQSDWGAECLDKEQLLYAATDVIYLHRLKDILELRLKREGRQHLAKASFEYLPIRIELDLLGWAEQDIFSHS